MLDPLKRIVVIGVLLVSVNLFAVQVEGSGDPWGVKGSSTVSNNYGYLGTNDYGVFGKDTSTGNYGYLGDHTYGAFGKHSSTKNLGYLGGILCGASGYNFTSRAIGYLGYGGYGAYGTTYGNSGILGDSLHGVYGAHSNGNYGYFGSASYGAYGRYGSNNYGYLGSQNYGVYGQNVMFGNYGYIGSASCGIYGRNNNGNYGYLGGSSFGVYGYAATTSSTGAYFSHTSGSYAYLARNLNGAEICGPDGDFVVIGVTGIGVFASSSNYAGAFYGDVYISGDLLVSGDKDNVIKLDNGTWVTMSATEAPYPEYTISGRTTLVNGTAQIEFEYPYAQVISEQIPIKVIVTPEGSYSGIYVKDVSTSGFTAVSEVGDKSATFSWMAIARVKGREQKTDYNAVTAKMQRLEETHRKMGLSTQTLRTPANNEESGEQLIMQSQPELSLSVPEICASGSVGISFQLPKTSNVHVSVFDASGRLIRTLVSEQMRAGYHSIIWDGTDEYNRCVSAGVYYARLEDGTSTRTAKVTVIN